MELARARDGKPIPILRAYRIASLVVALYWRKETSKPAILSLNTEIESGDGDTTEAIRAVNSLKALSDSRSYPIDLTIADGKIILANPGNKGQTELTAETARVLKPGGIAVIVYPWEPFRGFQAIVSALRQHKNPFMARQIHLHRLTPGRIVKFIVPDSPLHVESKLALALGIQYRPVFRRRAKDCL